MKKDKEMPVEQSIALPEAEAPSLPAEIQDAIGRKIRSVYSDMVAEPLPDKFRELLEQLAGSEKKS